MNEWGMRKTEKKREREGSKILMSKIIIKGDTI